MGKNEFNSNEEKELFWHSSSHLLAHALTELYPEIKLAIGPAITEGFYYDFDLDTQLKEEDLIKIEEKIKEISKRNLPITRIELSRKEALEFYKKNPYKTEMINGLPDEKISFYEQGNFKDMCRGPHLRYTTEIKAVKLIKLAGAYWRGDEKNKMLQRIYGIAFPKKEMMEAHLKQKDEAEKRNHIKLGRELDLFSMQKESPGNAFFHSNGVIVLNEMTKFMREKLFERNYQEIMTPLILKKELWLKSGHWDHYKENMYFTMIDEEEQAVKPMNCPGGLLVYKSKRHSYKELPIKAGEFGVVHRHEKSGVLNGLFRVRKFTQDDAHVFCTEEQLTAEIIDLIKLCQETYNAFGFKDYHIELSTRPEKSMGSNEIWEIATNALKDALEAEKINFKINEGDGAFYGPKIDFHIKDSIGRSWQCGTIQVDFSMPEKFDLTYIGADDNEHRPVMVHRAIFGSLERFFGILIENYAGAFPLWLAPKQIIIVPVGERVHKYAEKILLELRKEFIRTEIDSRNETVSYRIRDAQLNKIPLMIVVGEKEEADNSVNVRTRDGKQKTIKIDEFIKETKEKIKKRENE
ncbi:MAG: threonine--tRNA ligase [Candidatus Diapherotrites archaeon]|nr:threonine--tRNA ligase [Candidatus Diapherotrites archaeon]